MKKVFLTLALLGLFVSSVAVFAEAAPGAFAVQSVTGKVEYESAPGTFSPVTVGLSLAPSTVVSTGANSILVVKSGERVVTIKALQKGAIDKLASAGSGKGVKIGAKAVTTDVTADEGQTRTNVSTASTRASDATKDLEWADSEDKK